MNTRSLTKRIEKMPAVFDDFFNKPLLDLFDGGFTPRMMRVPAVNIIERKDDYLVSMAAPGLKKEDFKIYVEGDLLIISSEKEEEKEEKDKKGENDERYTRREYSYSSFERSFTLPDGVNKDKIDAHYEDGLLKLILPKKEEAKRTAASKQVAVK